MTNFLEIFLEKIPSLEKRIDLLEEENRKLSEENDLLREQLHLNSKNSSKPPSSDQKGSSQPQKTGGAKPGHKGRCRTMFPPEQVDRFVTVKAEICPARGNSVVPVNEPLVQKILSPIPSAIGSCRLPNYRNISAALTDLMLQANGLTKLECSPNHHIEKRSV